MTDGKEDKSKEKAAGGGNELSRDSSVQQHRGDSIHSVSTNAQKSEGQCAKNIPEAQEFNCSICYDLLLDPVVGSCGHDFCQHCYEQWRKRCRRRNCPICRKRLPNDLGVCHRLKDMIEMMFPEESSERRKQVEQWRKEEQEGGMGDDLEALMMQISHLLEDANSLAEPRRETEPEAEPTTRSTGQPGQDGEISSPAPRNRQTRHSRHSRQSRQIQPGPSSRPAAVAAATDETDAQRSEWIRSVRYRSSLIYPIAFTMGVYDRRRRRRSRRSNSQQSSTFSGTFSGTISGTVSGTQSVTGLAGGGGEQEGSSSHLTGPRGG